MEMKSTASYPHPPPYSSIMPYPGPYPSSYGYPHPATSGTPNHPVAPPITQIGFREVYTVESNPEPSPMVTDHKVQLEPGSQCCVTLFGLFFIIVSLVAVVVLIIRIWE